MGWRSYQTTWGKEKTAYEWLHDGEIKAQQIARNKSKRCLPPWNRVVSSTADAYRRAGRSLKENAKTEETSKTLADLR